MYEIYIFDWVIPLKGFYKMTKVQIKGDGRGCTLYLDKKNLMQHSNNDSYF